MSSILQREANLSDSHGQFDYLCALEASGQISDNERPILREHLKTCAECRQALEEYNVCADVLTQNFEARAATRVPSGMYERFRARALNHGIALTKGSDEALESSSARARWRNIGVWSAAAAVTAVLIGVLILRRPVAIPGPNQHEQVTIAPAITNQPTANLALRDEVARLQAKQKNIEAQLQDEHRALRSAEIDKDTLNAQIAALRAESDEARKSEQQAKADIRRLTEELAAAQAGSNEARNESAQYAKELTELKDRLATLDVQLSRERQLSATLQEMSTLMENRDVRVIQLGGVRQGKQMRAFGRAFYVPGQKLVLFAYDLSDPKTLSAHSFYVWGEKPGTDQPAQVLGRLTLEDQKDDRWAIRIEGPDVFARINEVFITLESSKGNVERPTGQPMLVTSLIKPTP